MHPYDVGKYKKETNIKKTNEKNIIIFKKKYKKEADIKKQDGMHPYEEDVIGVGRVTIINNIFRSICPAGTITNHIIIISVIIINLPINNLLGLSL